MAGAQVMDSLLCHCVGTCEMSGFSHRTCLWNSLVADNGGYETMIQFHIALGSILKCKFTDRLQYYQWTSSHTIQKLCTRNNSWHHIKLVNRDIVNENIH